MEDGEGYGKAGDIAGHIGQAPGARAIEAVLGDGIADVIDSVVGQVEGVAVGVEQHAVALLGVVVVDRGEGRQRGRGGRVAGAVARGASRG